MISCPSCGAGLHFDIKSQLMKCDYCGSQHDPLDFAGITKDALMERKSRGNAKRGTMEMAAYKCPQCGAELYTADKTDITVVCSYCGGANIIFDRMCHMKRPDYIIPFKLTKEDCIRQYRNEIKRSFFTPRYMKAKVVVDSFRAIYMPYWSFDIEHKGETSLDGVSLYREGNYSCINHYSYKGNVDATYKGLAHDASCAFDDGISECLAPFDAAERLPFSPAFLSGFYADAPDVNPQKFEDDAVNLAKKNTVYSILMEEKNNRSQIDYSQILSGDPEEVDIPCRITERAEVFYPVWFMSCRRGEKIYYAAVNGQTGKVSADTPISPLKFMLFSILMAALFFAVLNVFSVLKPGWALAVILLLMAAGLVLTDRVYNKLQNKLAGIEDGEILRVMKKPDKIALMKRINGNTAIIYVEFAMFFAFIRFYSGIKPALVPMFVCLAISMAKLLVPRFQRKTLSKNQGKTKADDYSTGSAEKKSDRILYRIFKIVGILEIIVGLIIIIASPVVNNVFYIYSFVVASSFLLMVLFLFSIHARLASRRPPQFNKTGGDDNA